MAQAWWAMLLLRGHATLFPEASEKESREVKDTRVEEEAVDEIGEHAAQIKSEKLAASFFSQQQHSATPMRRRPRHLIFRSS